MPEQTFRYLACGGTNMVLGLGFYFISFHFWLNGKVFDFGFYALKAHNAALVGTFLLNFLLGFYLMRNVVFVESNIKGRIQMFRYFLTMLVNLFINYLLLQLFVLVFKWPAFVSQIATTFIIVFLSYLSQKHFSFKTKDGE